MCGIAGIFHYAEPDKSVDRDLLLRMTRVLAHRGPDDEGFYVDGPIGLGHRRLAIVDLSPTGHQPMGNTDGSCWISYNGELYNHLEFRTRLVAKGHCFRGSSDTETLLHLLEEEGPEALASAVGIFGFAFWDARHSCLTLARDPLGVKQLYFHDDGRRIVFASEIKALLVCPDVPRDPDPEAINQYLHFHSALFERTFFRDIQQLRAGEYMQITRYGNRRRTYWAIQDFAPMEEPTERLIANLRGQLTSVVGDQLMSDVPVGAFFSGGVDSSAVAAYAARNGKPPICFGVHFSNQGVPDERPFQEVASKALGLDLHLITMDGSTFPDDLMHLLYHQDEPVIGAAMFPMYYVSKLAASHVKVCLGGQGADEIFGGYARYALARPNHVIKSWFAGRQGTSGANPQSVSGNLGKQLGESKTILRLLRNVRRLADWESSYFENFAKVPESIWAQIFGCPEFYSRERCRQLFHEKVNCSAASDPADKIMHWDVQTYLAGLFQQDDRMSMAVGLESRVPLADPRLVQFAFRAGFDVKFRGGASKWLLRQAVSDCLPQVVLTRRKVGFDTPAETWMKGPHFGFVKDLLLSQRSRQRGFWNSRALADLIARTSSPDWFDVLWKVVCIEAWASVFLDKQVSTSGEDHAYVLQRTSNPAALTSAHKTADAPHKVRDFVKEVRELGLSRTVTRSLWEVKTRSGAIQLLPETSRGNKESTSGAGEREAVQVCCALSLAPKIVAGVMQGLVSPERLSRLALLASEATRGRILCFSRWMADFGSPIEWHRNPCNSARWPADIHWSKVLRREAQVGDVKLTWEAARFPQAYYMARAASFEPSSASHLASSFFEQVEGFIAANRPEYGVHWSSGQEIVFRLMAWFFALQVFERLGYPPPPVLQEKLRRHLHSCAIHLKNNIEYARHSVYNNHLITEALGLYVLGGMLPALQGSAAMATEGLQLMEQQATQQFYPDGGYVQHSHNYHRVAVQTYLWATAHNMARGLETSPNWNRAMESSLDFLLAHQNPSDGLLSNFGSNDGALPVPLSTCDFSDFRPTLQAISVATRGERIYKPGPWDEMAVWLFGAEALNLPLRQSERKSVSFAHSGYHVLRGHNENSFASFRCGSLLERFSQIDMLHLDVWWRGHNVLVDAGSYMYNGPQEWHDYCLRTGSHNTVKVDGLDQMVHLRRFKNVHWTQAKLLSFKECTDWVLCEGEHYGFQRLPGKCVHRRSVLYIKDDVWIVLDAVMGFGSHRIRLHWLAGDYPFQAGNEDSSLHLYTPDGLFSVSTFDDSANLLSGNVVVGGETPPRGWLSRSYAEKVPVPSLAVEREGKLPLLSLSVLCAGVPEVQASDANWRVVAGEATVEFTVSDTGIDPAGIRVLPLCQQ
jgi:asparagine synthase (glutamine-hydrolysing)